MRSTQPFLLLLSLLAPFAAHAQTPVTTPSLELDRLVVTANRNELPVGDVPQRVVVIDAQTIERTGALTVPDTLKKNATLDVIQYPAAVVSLVSVSVDSARNFPGRTNTRCSCSTAGRRESRAWGICRSTTLTGSSVKGSGVVPLRVVRDGRVVNFITKQSSGRSKAVFRRRSVASTPLIFAPMSVEISRSKWTQISRCGP